MTKAKKDVSAGSLSGPVSTTCAENETRPAGPRKPRPAICRLGTGVVQRFCNFVSSFLAATYRVPKPLFYRGLLEGQGTGKTGGFAHFVTRLLPAWIVSIRRLRLVRYFLQFWNEDRLSRAAYLSDATGPSAPAPNSRSSCT
jgi:hypothetical protein